MASPPASPTWSRTAFLWKPIRSLTRHFIPPWFAEDQSGSDDGAHVTNFTRWGARSVTGNFRDCNEDRCFADSRQGLFFVVDGMGGHCGGETASEIIAETIPVAMHDLVDDRIASLKLMQRAVEGAVEAGRTELMDFAVSHPECASMGATLALAVVVDSRLYYTRVGDSRVYHLRNGVLRRLTRDETFVSVLVEAGAISEEDSRKHPFRHVVTNYVGVKPLQNPTQVSSFELEPGDRVILVTDGVTDGLEDKDLLDVLEGCETPQTAADVVVDAALGFHSKDNVTCVVVDMLSVTESEPEDEPESEFDTSVLATSAA